MLRGSDVMGSRFGLSIASLGDINADGINGEIYRNVWVNNRNAFKISLINARRN